MAPQQPSSSSFSPSAALAAVGQGGPAVARPSPKVYHCNFCKETFTTCHGVSGHYNVHKNLPHEMWIRYGPRHSKIRRDILEALKMGKDYQYKRKTWNLTGRARKARVLAPRPIREVHPTDSPQLPWCALGFPSHWGWASNPDAVRSPQSCAAGRLIRVQGPGGLLVLRTHYGQISNFTTRAHFKTTGPVVRIQGPNGLFIRRDFRAEASNLTPGRQETGLANPVGAPPGFPVKDINGAGSSSSNSTPGCCLQETGPAARNDGPPPGFLVRNISAAELYGPRPKTKPPAGPERAPAPGLRGKYGVPTVESKREKSSSVPDLNLPSSCNCNKNKKIIKKEI